MDRATCCRKQTAWTVRTSERGAACGMRNAASLSRFCGQILCFLEQIPIQKWQMYPLLRLHSFLWLKCSLAASRYLDPMP